jgi:predicted RNA-binding Zn-ribbon protein involved in translation (DUF1610 family)
MSSSAVDRIQEKSGLPLCPLCGQPLSLRLARGRKSGKPFVMLICPQDGRHLRAFITDKEYVQGVLAKLEVSQSAKEGKP